MAADEEMQRAIDKADATPLAEDAIFQHVYSELTPRLERQRSAFLEGRSGR